MSGKQKHTYCLLQYALAQTAFERLIYLLVAYSFVVFVRRCCKHGPGKRTLKFYTSTSNRRGLRVPLKDVCTRDYTCVTPTDKYARSSALLPQTGGGHGFHLNTSALMTTHVYMFVVSGHLYRPLPSSQPCGLRVKIKDGFGTCPPTFLGAGLSILVFL